MNEAIVRPKPQNPHPKWINQRVKQGTSKSYFDEPTTRPRHSLFGHTLSTLNPLTPKTPTPKPKQGINTPSTPSDIPLHFFQKPGRPTKRHCDGCLVCPVFAVLHEDGGRPVGAHVQLGLGLGGVMRFRGLGFQQLPFSKPHQTRKTYCVCHRAPQNPMWDYCVQ